MSGCVLAKPSVRINSPLVEEIEAGEHVHEPCLFQVRSDIKGHIAKTIHDSVVFTQFLIRGCISNALRHVYITICTM